MARQVGHDDAVAERGQLGLDVAPLHPVLPRGVQAQHRGAGALLQHERAAAGHPEVVRTHHATSFASARASSTSATRALVRRRYS